MSLTNHDLDDLREQGDHRLDDLLETYLAERRQAQHRVERPKTSLRRLLEEATRGERISQEFCDLHGLPIDDDYWKERFDFNDDKLEVAAKLFASDGTTIGGALLFSALPSTYAAAEGVQVLGSTDRLRNSPDRRILEVAQFLIDVTTASTERHRMLQPGHPGYRAARSLRIFHALVRARGREFDHDSVWINQEELLATLLTFTVNVFEVLERLNMTWTEDEQEAYLHLWDCVGELLGIGTVGDGVDHTFRSRPPIRPTSVDDAIRLLDRLRHRQWPQLDDDKLDLAALASSLGVDPSDELPQLSTGRVLFRALLDEIEAAAESGDRGRALAVFRYLLDEQVGRILGLGTLSPVRAVADHLGGMPIRTGRFTSVHPANPMLAWEMKQTLGRLTTRAFIHFVRQAPPDRPFRFHGLELDLEPGYET